MSNRTLDVTSQDWDAAVLASERPVLVDFWAAWCPPCRRVAPAVESLAASLADRYGVSTIPTFIVFAGGREVGRARGAMPEAELRRLVEPFLVAAPAAAGER